MLHAAFSFSLLFLFTPSDIVGSITAAASEGLILKAAAMLQGFFVSFLMISPVACHIFSLHCFTFVDLGYYNYFSSSVCHYVSFISFTYISFSHYYCIQASSLLQRPPPPPSAAPSAFRRVICCFSSLASSLHISFFDTDIQALLSCYFSHAASSFSSIV